MSQINFHGPKDVWAIEVLLLYTCSQGGDITPSWNCQSLYVK